jgi:hypothetical protein
MSNFVYVIVLINALGGFDSKPPVTFDTFNDCLVHKEVIEAENKGPVIFLSSCRNNSETTPLISVQQPGIIPSWSTLVPFTKNGPGDGNYILQNPTRQSTSGVQVR